MRSTPPCPSEEDNEGQGGVASRFQNMNFASDLGRKVAAIVILTASSVSKEISPEDVSQGFALVLPKRPDVPIFVKLFTH